jgi:hypothetical protein
MSVVANVSIIFQPGRQPQVDAIKKEVEDGSGVDEVVGEIGGEDEFEGDAESEGVHQLPTLSPWFNVHADSSPF